VKPSVTVEEPGIFIVFEGGDSVGKSTQVDLLRRRLAGIGRDVVETFEPGDSDAGALIRQIVLDPATGDLAPRAEALLYAADKAHHLYSVVRPALERGAVVICDRYVDSMLAYQGAGRVLKLAEVELIARWATEDLRPDLTVLLDVEPGHAVGAKVEKDRLEDAGDVFHQRVREHFLALAARDPEHYLVLDARGAREEIAAAVAARVADLLPGVEPSEPAGTVGA
jgi:dTMP kinase